MPCCLPSDINSDGVLDEQELEALFTKEVSILGVVDTRCPDQLRAPQVPLGWGCGACVRAHVCAQGKPVPLPWGKTLLGVEVWLLGKGAEQPRKVWIPQYDFLSPGRAAGEGVRP